MRRHAVAAQTRLATALRNDDLQQRRAADQALHAAKAAARNTHRQAASLAKVSAIATASPAAADEGQICG